jgi:hypothetical protein
MFDDQPSTSEDHSHMEYYVQLVRLLTECCETDDSAVRRTIKQSLPLDKALLPITSSVCVCVCVYVFHSNCRFLCSDCGD